MAMRMQSNTSFLIGKSSASLVYVFSRCDSRFLQKHISFFWGSLSHHGQEFGRRGLNCSLLLCPEVMQVNKPHTEHSTADDDDKAQLRFSFVFWLREMVVDSVCQVLQPLLRLLHLFCVPKWVSLHPCFWWFRLRLVIKKLQKIQSCIASPDKGLA